MLLRKRWIQNGLHCGQHAVKGRKSRNALQQSAASRRAVAIRGTNKRVEMTHLDLHTTDTFHTYLHLSNISLIALGGMKRKTNHCLCQTLGFPQILFSRPQFDLDSLRRHCHHLWRNSSLRSGGQIKDIPRSTRLASQQDPAKSGQLSIGQKSLLQPQDGVSLVKANTHA